MHQFYRFMPISRRKLWQDIEEADDVKVMLYDLSTKNFGLNFKLFFDFSCWLLTGITFMFLQTDTILKSRQCAIT